MNAHDQPMAGLESRIRDAESDLFAVLDVEVEVESSPGSRTRRSTKCPQATAHGSSTPNGSRG